ncbi:hypothetical protein TNIN_377211 [Trichonephila inaurata madagascariensis]|uniref:Uncharacterized protein n=1 Tax=Trichonephila inaurata madagascariensis TaxID=2747483 RepID=A0A8X6X8B9_9ARAC|nr:hypothetical protein TNIN_377211 [Trichonephila inaurata madagascariensis]
MVGQDNLCFNEVHGDKLVDRQIVMNKGKLISKLKDLRQRQKTPSLSTATIIEKKGDILSHHHPHMKLTLFKKNNKTAAEALFVKLKQYMIQIIHDLSRCNLKEYGILLGFCRHKFEELRRKV